MTGMRLFAITGQSNADESPADPSGLVVPGTVGLQYRNGAIGPIAKWQQFALTDNALSGEMVGIVNVAVGGTNQSDAEAQYIGAQNGSWDVAGALTPTAIASMQAAFTAFTNMGFTPHWEAINHCQGENSAAAIFVSNGAYSAMGNYLPALAGMIARFRAAFPGIRVNISQTGYPAGGLALPNWAWELACFKAIGDAQSAYAATDPLTMIGFSGASEFAVNGLQPTTPLGNLHYSVAGYDYRGREMALSYRAGIERARSSKERIWLTPGVQTPLNSSGVFHSLMLWLDAPPGGGHAAIGTLTVSGAMQPLQCEAVGANIWALDTAGIAFIGAPPGEISLDVQFTSGATVSNARGVVEFSVPL